MTIQPKKNEYDKKPEDRFQTPRSDFDKDNSKEEAKSALADGKGKALDTVLEAKDKAVDTLVEAKDKTIDTLVEAKDATVETLVETKDVVVEKLHEYKEVATQAASEAGDQAVRAGKATWAYARQNAVPLALVGIGASWLIAGSRRPRRLSDDRTDYAIEPRDVALSGRADGRWVEPRYGKRPSVRPTQRNGSSDSRNKVADAARRVEDEASDVGHQAKELAVNAGERAVEVYERASSAVRTQALRSRDFAQRQYVRVRDGSRELIRENPLAVGALTLATGVGVGMLLPSTRAEDALYGETRERLVGDARDVVAGAREAARGISDVAKDTARLNV